MKKFAIALALVATTSGAAFAGGPAVIPADPEPIAPVVGRVGSSPIIGVIGALALIALVAGGGSSSTTTTTSGS